LALSFLDLYQISLQDDGRVSKIKLIRAQIDSEIRAFLFQIDFVCVIRNMKGNKMQKKINIASWMGLITVVLAVYHLFSDGDFSFLMVRLAVVIPSTSS
jgi:hypothetical protein